MSTVGSEPECFSWSSRPTATGSMTINEAKYAALFTRASRVENLWRDNVEVLPEQAMDEWVEDEPKNEGIEDDIDMTKDEATGKFGYACLSFDKFLRMIRKVFVKRAKDMLKCLVDHICENWSSFFFKKLKSLP